MRQLTLILSVGGVYHITIRYPKGEDRGSGGKKKNDIFEKVISSSVDR